VTAVITAHGERKMTTSITEENGTTQSTSPVEAPKPKKKARVAAHRATVAPSNDNPGKRTNPAKKEPQGRKPGTGARQGTNAAKVLNLLKRPGGATARRRFFSQGNPHN
jgi:hypothetical protein